MALRDFIQNLEKKGEKEAIDLTEFNKIVNGLAFLKKVFEYDLSIPEFETLIDSIKEAYYEIKEDETKEYSGGKIATYIPPLAKANPNWFATSFCSVDSQFTEFGDT